MFFFKIQNPNALLVSYLRDEVYINSLRVIIQQTASSSSRLLLSHQSEEESSERSCGSVPARHPWNHSAHSDSSLPAVSCLLALVNVTYQLQIRPLTSPNDSNQSNQPTTLRGISRAFQREAVETIGQTN